MSIPLCFTTDGQRFFRMFMNEQSRADVGRIVCANEWSKLNIFFLRVSAAPHKRHSPSNSPFQQRLLTAIGVVLLGKTIVAELFDWPPKVNSYVSAIIRSYTQDWHRKPLVACGRSPCNCKWLEIEGLGLPRPDREGPKFLHEKGKRGCTSWKDIYTRHMTSNCQTNLKPCARNASAQPRLSLQLNTTETLYFLPLHPLCRKHEHHPSDNLPLTVCRVVAFRLFSLPLELYWSSRRIWLFSGFIPFLFHVVKTKLIRQTGTQHWLLSHAEAAQEAMLREDNPCLIVFLHPNFFASFVVHRPCSVPVFQVAHVGFLAKEMTPHCSAHNETQESGASSPSTRKAWDAVILVDL